MPNDRALRLCAIVPAYQARSTLPAVLEGLEGAVDAIIVVDDASSDGTAEFLRAWSDARGGNADALPPRDSEFEQRRVIVIRAVNGGKAAALADGFHAALARGHDLALTVDADGQHASDDAAFLAEAARGLPVEPELLLCGVRDPATPLYPVRSLTGRRLNDLAIRAQTGVQVEDSPCGLRVYSLALVRRVRCLSGRFAWEEEFITRAIWAGASYRTRSIRCIYAAAGERRSHYRFGRDYPEGVAINLWLCLLALLPPAPTSRSVRRFARQLGSLVSPRRAMDHLAGDSPSRLHGASAMAIGAAMLAPLGARWIGEIGAIIAPPAVVHDAPGASARSEWIMAGIGLWILLRLNGSLPIALIGAMIAAALVPLPVAPPLTALALLLVVSRAALRRRAR